MNFDLYRDNDDWWVGYYRGKTHHYVCFFTLVLRWNKANTAKNNNNKFIGEQCSFVALNYRCEMRLGHSDNRTDGMTTHIIRDLQRSKYFSYREGKWLPVPVAKT